MINIGTCVNYLCSPTIFDEKKDHDVSYYYPPSVTFCITGNIYTTGFFNSWTKFLFFLKENPTLINPHFVSHYSENIFESRNEMLGGGINKGEWQLPLIEDFDSKYLFFMDSNMVFEPIQIMRIIYKMVKFDLNILSAVCMQNDGVHSSAVKNDAEEVLVENEKFEYFTKDELIAEGSKFEGDLVKVSNVGLNFVCVKNELFENIEYPWFEPESFVNLKGFYSDSHSVFRKMKKLDHKVLCDSSVIVGRDHIITAT